MRTQRRRPAPVDARRVAASAADAAPRTQARRRAQAAAPPPGRGREPRAGRLACRLHRRSRPLMPQRHAAAGRGRSRGGARGAAPAARHTRGEGPARAGASARSLRRQLAGATIARVRRLRRGEEATRRVRRARWAPPVSTCPRGFRRSGRASAAPTAMATSRRRRVFGRSRARRPSGWVWPICCSQRRGSVGPVRRHAHRRRPLPRCCLRWQGRGDRPAYVPAAG